MTMRMWMLIVNMDIGADDEKKLYRRIWKFCAIVTASRAELLQNILLV